MNREREFSGVPWAQGRLLDTPQTRRWTDAERAAGDAREKCMAFAFFDWRDAGRGRQLVRVFESAADCLAAVALHNAVLAEREAAAADAARLQWLLHRLSGAELRRVGVVVSSGGLECGREAIDAAMARAGEDATQKR